MTGDTGDDELITLAEFENQVHYVLARSVLESAGIECFSPNENLARLAGIFSPVLGVWGFSLQVRAGDFADAKHLLESGLPSGEVGDDMDG